jgi:hypothetical protein
MAGNNSAFNPYAIAAGKVPAGISDDDRNSYFKGVPMTAVLAVIVSFAIVFCAIRLHVKVNIMRRLGWDDCELNYLSVIVCCDANKALVVCSLALVIHSCYTW